MAATAVRNRGEAVMGPGAVMMGVGNWKMRGVYIVWGSCAHKSLSKANHEVSSILKS